MKHLSNFNCMQLLLVITADSLFIIYVIHIIIIKQDLDAFTIIIDSFIYVARNCTERLEDQSYCVDKRYYSMN